MAPLPQAGQVSLVPLSSESSTERSPLATVNTRAAGMIFPACSFLMKFCNPAKSDRGTRPHAALCFALAASACPPFPGSLLFPPLPLDAAASRVDANHTALVEELETERTGRWDSLNQAHLDEIAKLEGSAGFLADQSMTLLVMIEILMADGGGRDEAVGAGLVQPHEEAGAGEPGDAGGKAGADAIGKISGDQPVGSFTFRRHGAPLGSGNRLGDLFEQRYFGVGQAVIAELEGADQPPVHHEIGIAADRRGEVRVAPQVQTEMTEIAGAVLGLSLAAQHHLAHKLGSRARPRLGEDAVEMSGL